MSKVLDGFTQVEVATTDTRQFVDKIPQSAIIRVIPKEGAPQKPKATRGRKPAEKKEAVVEDAPKEGVSEE